MSMKICLFIKKHTIHISSSIKSTQIYIENKTTHLVMCKLFIKPDCTILAPNMKIVNKTKGTIKIRK